MIEVMDSINNHFVRSIERLDVKLGVNNTDYNNSKFNVRTSYIKGGFREIYMRGMWIIIKDSYLNDGIYKILDVSSGEITVEGMLEIENTGKPIRVIASTPPSAFVDLATEIKDYKEDKLGIASETIDDYSVSFTGDGTWEDKYRGKLNKYRSVYPDIPTNKPVSRW